jgi:hypothetical protein
VTLVQFRAPDYICTTVAVHRGAANMGHNESRPAR